MTHPKLTEGIVELALSAVDRGCHTLKQIKKEVERVDAHTLHLALVELVNRGVLFEYKSGREMTYRRCTTEDIRAAAISLRMRPSLFVAKFKLEDLCLV